MMRILKTAMVLSGLLLSTVLWAQDRTITGKVVDENNDPMPTVTIYIKGTTNGVVSDADGNYRITVPNSDGTLVFQFVSYKTQEIVIGNQTTIDVTMEPEYIDGGEVIVTAFGIGKQKRALGYAADDLDGKELEAKPQADVARLLRGKFPGVQINTTGGFLGRGTNVIVRSKSSVTGDNQPLYIVDGVAFDSQRFIDLDPNNIENISVLKGLTASLVYGQEGRNGVILITTKTGLNDPDAGDRLNISVSQTFFSNTVGNLPNFQNTYGQGANNAINTTFFGTWGDRFNGQIVPHPLAPILPEFAGQTVEYKAVPNNVSDFFSRGLGSLTSVVGQAQKGNTSVGFSFARNQETGYVDENRLGRLNFGANINSKIHDRVTLNTSFQYSQTEFIRPTAGFFQLLLWIPRNLDIHNLPFENPATGENVYYRTNIVNPRWNQKYSRFSENTNRFFGKVGLTIDISDQVKFTYNLGIDSYARTDRDYINRGAPVVPLGFLNTTNLNVLNYDHNFLFSAGGIELSPELTLDITSGLNLRNKNSSLNGLTSTDQVVFGYINHANFRTHANLANSEVTTNVVGLWAQAEFDYQGYLYMTLSGRNDWGSQLEKENRSVFYPSASVSWIPTTMFENLQTDNLNYLKLRFGYGTSAGFPNPFLTRPVLAANATSFIGFDGTNISTNAVSGFQPNPDLKPELHQEFEAGFEGQFFKRRLVVDASVYRRISKDQILNRSLPNTTGFSTTVINAGRIDTEGIELGVTYTPIDRGNFRWDITTNFTAYETTVIDLPEERINISNNLNFAIEGQPLGVFRGTYALRDDEGNLLINPTDGKIISNAAIGLDNKIIGDPNPDFDLTLINSIRWKGFTFMAQIEYRHGGDIFSNTMSNLLRRGVTKDTEGIRERSHIITGVLGDPDTGEAILDENGSKIENTIQIAPNDLFFINLMDVNENIVVDGSTIRLREVGVSYDLPEKLLVKTPFKAVNIGVNAQNFFFRAFNFPRHLNMDPEVLSSGVGNGQGLDFQVDPSMKKFGVSLKVNF